MIYHSVILNFGQSFPDELQVLLEKSYPHAVHPNRIAGFYSSRICLLENLRLIYPEADFKDLQMEGFSRLLAYPDIVLSLSHTPLAGACALARKKDFISVGIDIESEDRIVKESIIERVTTEKDLELSPLNTWCLKEAIYKCVSNSSQYSGVLEFKDMEIKDTQWVHPPSGLRGEWSLFSEKNHQGAIATLRNQNS